MTESPSAARPGTPGRGCSYLRPVSFGCGIYVLVECPVVRFRVSVSDPSPPKIGEGRSVPPRRGGYRSQEPHLVKHLPMFYNLLDG